MSEAIARQWHDLGREPLMRVMRRFAAPSPLKVLEIGCGKGMNACAIYERGDIYLGIDRNQFNIMRAKSSARFADFWQMDFCKEPLPPGPFDLIVDRSSLSYNSNEDISAFLAKVPRVLEPDGMMIISDLYMPGNPEPARGTGARTFEEQELRELFKGFRIIHLAQHPRDKAYELVCVL